MGMPRRPAEGRMCTVVEGDGMWVGEDEGEDEGEGGNGGCFRGPFLLVSLFYVGNASKNKQPRWTQFLNYSP